jgi:hypothetical protein
MGRSTTPKYALVVDCTGVHCTRMAWHVKPPVGCSVGYGKPTAENLAKYIETFRKSLHPGGANEHLMKAYGSKALPNAARIILNDGSGTVVAEWKAPMFWAI